MALLEFYNHITSEAGTKIIVNGWNRSGAVDAVRMGKSTSPSIDLFDEFLSLPSPSDCNSLGSQLVIPLTEELTERYVNERVDDDDDFSKWGNRGDLLLLMTNISLGNIKLLLPPSSFFDCHVNVSKDVLR